LLYNFSPVYCSYYTVCKVCEIHFYISFIWISNIDLLWLWILHLYLIKVMAKCVDYWNVNAFINFKSLLQVLYKKMKHKSCNWEVLKHESMLVNHESVNMHVWKFWLEVFPTTKPTLYYSLEHLVRILLFWLNEVRNSYSSKINVIFT